MEIKQYKENWIDADYQDSIDNVAEAISLLDGAFKIRAGNKESFKVEHLNRLLPAIIEGIKHENKTKPKSTPATDFAVDNLGRIKRLSMDNPGTKAALILRVNYELLYCAMPDFASLEPVPPGIQGCESFIKMAEATIKKLPKSIRQKIQDIVIIETDSRSIYGLALSARKRVIHIMSHNSNVNPSRTLLHEIGHIALNHLDGNSNKTNEETESEANEFALKYNQA